MGDHDRGGDRARWRSLRAALDRLEESDGGDGTTDTEVDLSESEPLDVEVSASEEDTAATLDFDPASARVLTVDTGDEFGDVDRERRGPVLSVGDEDTDD